MLYLAGGTVHFLWKWTNDKVLFEISPFFPLCGLATGVCKGIVKHFDVIAEIYGLFGFVLFKDKTYSSSKNK